MPSANDVRIVDALCEFEPTPYRAPLKFGGRIVDSSQNINVSVTVETGDGRRATGFGSMPIGNVWGWPSKVVEPTDTAEATRRTAVAVVRAAGQYRGSGHPLDITHDLETGWRTAADSVTRDLGLAEPMPDLMVLVAASPLDAALHDAYGKAHRRNVFDCYGPDFANHDLAHYLTPDFRGEYLNKYTLRLPKPWLPLYHLVGALDPLTPGEVKQPINDGLPESLDAWISAEGLTHLKIKLNGDGLAWDVERVLAVEAVASAADRRPSRPAWFYSLDFNEKCASVDHVMDFLAQVRERSPAALERTLYIEQPTARDLKANPGNRMHRAAEVKPVVIDESLTSLETLLLAREQGYSGVALKTCKGHGAALLIAAYAQKHGLFLCVQDLTCPGASFLHSAGLSARLPGVAAVEGNARQYCPAANRAWAERYPSLFHVRGGAVETGLLTGPGLGH
jgi:L-alanine-DL-glutamate epimerase-like enolase superfamily enzyme